MKSFKEIKETVKELAKEKAVSMKDIAIKRAKEKSTWIGIITKVGAIVGFSMTGVPVDLIAGMVATYIGGLLTAANTTKEVEENK